MHSNCKTKQHHPQILLLPANDGGDLGELVHLEPIADSDFGWRSPLVLYDRSAQRRSTFYAKDGSRSAGRTCAPDELDGFCPV